MEFWHVLHPWERGVIEGVVAVEAVGLSFVSLLLLFLFAPGRNRDDAS